jgi:hypothetical protein
MQIRLLTPQVAREALSSHFQLAPVAVERVVSGSTVVARLFAPAVPASSAKSTPQLSLEIVDLVILQGLSSPPSGSSL